MEPWTECHNYRELEGKLSRLLHQAGYPAVPCAASKQPRMLYQPAGSEYPVVSGKLLNSSKPHIPSPESAGTRAPSSFCRPLSDIHIAKIL